MMSVMFNLVETQLDPLLVYNILREVDAELPTHNHNTQDKKDDVDDKHQCTDCKD